jgi:hypothetical protein
MHIVSLGAPATPTKDEQEGIRAFYESLRVVIPCPHCRNHYTQALSSMPIRLQSRADLIEWVYEIHNYVNQQLGKPSLSWEGFITHMQNLRATPAAEQSLGSVPLLLLGLSLGIVGTLIGSRLLRR